jgi:hypothetical protein
VIGIDKIDDHLIRVLYAEKPEQVFDDNNLEVIDEQRQKGFNAPLDRN